MEIRRLLVQLRDDNYDFHTGSLFSGSAIQQILLKFAIENQAAERLNVTFKVVHQYCAEIGEAQIAWIFKAHPDLKYLFGKASEVASEMCYDKKSDAMVIVPFIHLLLWGFACTTGSKANNHRTVNNVQESKGKTGDTFEEGLAVIRYHKPPFTILENTKDLGAVIANGDKSDLKYIEETLEAEGYWAKGFELEAYDYSSKTWRCRLVIAAVLEERRSETREAHIRNTLRHLKLPPHPITDFLIDNIEAMRRMKKKRFIVDSVYQEVHASFYAERKFTWPPSRAALAEMSGLLDQSSATQRIQEVVYYIGKAFAFKFEQADRDGFQYCDVNRSLEWLTGNDGQKNPWLQKVGTFTTKTVWLLRTVANDIRTLVSWSTYSARVIFETNI